MILRSRRGVLAHEYPEWYLSCDGCRLFVQEYGKGSETVVALHGGWGAEHSYLLDAFQWVLLIALASSTSP